MEKKTERFEFLMSKDLKKRLKEKAKKDGVSVASIIDKAIRFALSV